MMALQTAKRDLRKRMRETLQTLSNTSIIQQCWCFFSASGARLNAVLSHSKLSMVVQLTLAAGIATNKLLSLSEYQNAKSVAVFLSMPSGELSTRSIVQDAFQRGKEVYIPYIHTVDKVSVMDMLALESINEFESLQPDKWGIPSLQPTQIPGRRDCFSGKGLDLIVMPGMAFDSEFRRLGHGKGYYDHFLKRYSQWSSKMPFLVALSLQEQLLAEDIPVMEHDWLIDAIVVGDGRYLDRRS